MATATQFRLWDLGQHHLAEGRYVAARSALESAEQIAWRTRDAQSLARIYLPLLEARRLIRYQAAEGAITIEDGVPAIPLRSCVKEFLFLARDAGTLLLPATGGCTITAAEEVRHASQRTGRRLEVLIIHRHRGKAHLASPHASTFSAGIPIEWTRDSAAAVGLSPDPTLTIPLPPPDVYEGAAGLGAVARESIFVAWEALALRWQQRHPLRRRAGPWEEMALLRDALRIDPACEPITMRLIALAEGVQRQGGAK